MSSNREQTALKIHILGGPGSGKTTLAKNLSTRFNVPHYDLDLVFQKHGSHMDACVDETIAIAAQPAWITEGIYLIMTDPLLYHADYIVFLPTSWPIATWRMIRRHVTRSLHGTNPYPGLNGIKLLFKLLQFGRNYYVKNVNTDPSLTEAMRVYLAEQKESDELPPAEILLTRLEKYLSAIPLTASFVCTHLEKYQEKIFFVKNKADQAHLLTLLSNRQREQNSSGQTSTAIATGLNSRDLDTQEKI